MAVTFEQATQMVRTWLISEKQEIAARKIAEKLHEIDIKTSLLVHPDTAGAANINRQRLFRVDDGWINGRTAAQRTKFMLLLPAIELAIIESGHIKLVMKMRSYSSETIRELTQRRERIESDLDSLFGVILSMSERPYGGGPAGNSLYH
ncbi:hypothetical protein [Klebsiella aerogenes]|uniref:hypothetical protein n=1 Tax=Klebsiella aerogenes TaxID=548 RepID=UPI0034D2633F